MKLKVPKVKGAKPNKKMGKGTSSKVGTATKPVGKPRMRAGGYPHKAKSGK